MKNAIGSASLLSDDDVLVPSRSLEINGFEGLQHLKTMVTEQDIAESISLLHWKNDWVRAQQAGIPSVSSTEGTQQTFTQVMVAAQRDRQGTLADGLEAWARCQPGGSVLLHGGNDIGIRTSGKQLGRLLQVAPEVVVSRAHSRVLRFVKPVSAPAVDQLSEESLTSPSGKKLATQPGVFAAGRLDRGAAVMLQAFQTIAPNISNGSSIVDLGCGSGVLGIEALSFLPNAQLYAADADARACKTTTDNLKQFKMDQRSQVYWWDSSELIAWPQADLVLSNPPWHLNGLVDRGPGLRMCEAVGRSLKPGGSALVVATITQPFEHILKPIGRLENVLEADGFKVLHVRKS